MNIRETFSKRVYHLRLAKGAEYTRQKVANELGISRASLEYYEKGQRMPDIEVAAKIAEYYNVSTDYLLGRSDVKTVNTNLQSICEFTGLTEEAVLNLHQYQYTNDYTYQDDINIINKILGYNGGEFNNEFPAITLSQCLCNNSFLLALKYMDIIRSLYKNNCIPLTNEMLTESELETKSRDSQLILTISRYVQYRLNDELTHLQSLVCNDSLILDIGDDDDYPF